MPLRFLVLLLLFLPLTVAALTVYRVVHPDGTVEFTDEPHPGAEAVTISEPQLVGDPDRPAAEEPPYYRRLAVTAPAADTTVRDPAGRVAVALRLEPPLREGDRVALYLGGERVREAAATGFELTDLESGTYTLRAEVVGPDDRVRLACEPIKFFLLRLADDPASD